MLRTDLVGQTIAGTYRVEKLLGKGGMGAVYAAKHLRLPTSFAIKVLHAEAAGNDEIFARFRREAQITSSLKHPNIVQVVDYNHMDDDTPYIVMELLEGEDLQARLKRKGRLSYPETVEVCQAVGAGLSVAHKSGVIHRDLKPQNLFIARCEQVDIIIETLKIVDFGISKIKHATTISLETNGLLGTPNYMSPEQASEKNGEIDQRTDQWALAAILYQCLTGRVAFLGDSLAKIIFQVILGEPPLLRSLAPEVPEAAAEAIGRALKKERDQRYSSIIEFVHAFSNCPTGGGRQPQPSTSEPAVQLVDHQTPRASFDAIATAETVAKPAQVPESVFDPIADLPKAQSGERPITEVLSSSPEKDERLAQPAVWSPEPPMAASGNKLLALAFESRRRLRQFWAYLGLVPIPRKERWELLRGLSVAYMVLALLALSAIWVGPSVLKRLQGSSSTVSSPGQAPPRSPTIGPPGPVTDGSRESDEARLTLLTPNPSPTPSTLQPSPAATIQTLKAPPKESATVKAPRDGNKATSSLAALGLNGIKPIDPYHAKLKVEEARLEINSGRLEVAMQRCKDAAGNQEVRGLAFTCMGEVEFERHYYAKALHWGTQALKEKPGKDVYRLLGNVYYKIGDCRKATKYSHKVLEADSTDPMAQQLIELCDRPR